jgi:hypothetical protein
MQSEPGAAAEVAVASMLTFCRLRDMIALSSSSESRSKKRRNKQETP